METIETKTILVCGKFINCCLKKNSLKQVCHESNNNFLYYLMHLYLRTVTSIYSRFLLHSNFQRTPEKFRKGWKCASFSSVCLVVCCWKSVTWNLCLHYRREVISHYLHDNFYLSSNERSEFDLDARLISKFTIFLIFENVIWG